ncbi:lymphocyte function-associated antigen 3 isoform X1 [Dermochelys coriacea]|uniref:lymphocyte function-associated antigen 3 isoform X1 n=1 Tax=Dermochelys coriacea TaxID=27794 RepID=UPI001CA870C4|nr:lymphocyte function-associated antigen 3 isoform X1 [Dermochelys coriacea]
MGLAGRLSSLGLRLLLSALLVCTRSQDQESVFAIVGEEFTFSPKFIGKIQEVTWMKGRNKVAEWDYSDGLPTYFSSLAGREQLDTSGNLTIKKLNLDDTAEYEAQVLADDNDQLQFTKFVLEVLDPPPPSVLNCSVTNGLIRISCVIKFSKEVHYSWYRDDIKIMHANNSVLELKENVDPSEKVFCVREVSKTKINNSISLSACFWESPKSLSRGRNGLIAIFVIIIILLLFMGALFFLWKRGLLSNILYQIRTKHSVVDKTEDLTEDGRFLEESSQKEVNTKCIVTEKNKRDYSTIYYVTSEKNQLSYEEKNSKESKSVSQADLFSTQENADSENITKESQEPGSNSRLNHESGMEFTKSCIFQDEEKNSKESKSVSQADLFSTQENADSENITKESQEPGSNSRLNHESGMEFTKSCIFQDEEKNSKESKSVSQADLFSTQENADSENITKESQEPGSNSRLNHESGMEFTKSCIFQDEEKNSKESKSVSQADLFSTQENADSENITKESQEPGSNSRLNHESGMEFTKSCIFQDEEKNSKESKSVSQADLFSTQENADSENITKESQEPGCFIWPLRFAMVFEPCLEILNSKGTQTNNTMD